MQSSLWYPLIGLATLAAATPISPPLPAALSEPRPIFPRQDNSTNSTAPCAQVSAIVYKTGILPVDPKVPAQIAYDCINSVPFNASSAKRLLKGMRPYMEWQSTLTVLKDPPAEYIEKVQPAVDIVGGLDQIGADIDAGKFKTEYEFGWSLYTLIQSAHDGHFSYVPDSVGTVFNWGRPIPLVSVSEDGMKLPSVFAFPDILGLQYKNISYTPSPVVEIDGQDVTEFLEELSQYGSLQDRDALYNNVFYELAQVSLGSSGSGTGMFTGGGRGRWVYPGPTTTLKFANGTEYTMENYARVLQTFREITTGEELAERLFYYGASTGDDAPKITEMSPGSAAAIGYPTPIVPGPGNLINGFFIDTPGYEDVAVLQVPNFVGDQSAEVAFQRTTQQFIPKALSAGKKKLIIDLQANGGGTILQGYDLYKQLFPEGNPYGANRFRYTEAANLIGKSFSSWGSKFPRVTRTNNTVKQVQASYFDYHSDTTVDGKPWSSWQEKVGPQEVNGDQYTQNSRWNLSDVHIMYNSGGINITGYGPLANGSQEQPFEAANIVILTDGYCASTCTIFMEFLTKQAGVKTIAMGGRSNSDKIQAIGGVKGVNNYQYSYIQSLASLAVTRSPPDEVENYKNSVLVSDYSDDIVFNRAASSPGVNTRDGLKYQDDSGIPLQFIYEEADCRLYYTPEMTTDATAIWKAAADVTWGSGKCVGGSSYGKRETEQKTTNLNRRNLKVSQAVALKQFEAFEKSFDLETVCSMTGDGFMHP